MVCLGSSGIGKTTWAKSYAKKPSLFVTHIDDLKKFRADEHKSLIFDDVSFYHYPIQSQIHLCDVENPRSIHVRYGTVSLPKGVQKIFTCNEEPLNVTHEAVARRIKLVYCRENDLALFHF
jgi:hypothetical protein